MFQVVSVYTAVVSSVCRPAVLGLLFEKYTAAYSTESFSCKEVQTCTSGSKSKLSNILDFILEHSDTVFLFLSLQNKFYSNYLCP